MALTYVKSSGIDITGSYTVNNMTASANVSANYFIGNGSQLTGLPASYANANVAAYLPTYTGNVSAAYFSGNGSELTHITGGNVDGQVGNSLVAGTVYTAAQPSITSVGTLTSLSISGLTTATGGVKTPNISDTVGTATIFTKHNDVSGDVGIVGNLVVGTSGSGNVTATYIVANGSSLTHITGGNVDGQVGNALVAGTVYTAAQPSITSVGTLTSLTVSGNTTSSYFSGNGSELSHITGGNVDGQVSNALVAGTVYTAAQPSITSVGTLTSVNVSGNATASYFIGSGEYLTGLPASYANSNVAAYLPTYTGEFSVANITSTGNVTASYFIGNGSSLTHITGGNVDGQVGNALVSGTVYTAAQPSITSVGTLTGLTSTGTIDLIGASNIALGPVGNLHISGGSANYVLTTDGAGTLSWAEQTGGGGAGSATYYSDTFTGDGSTVNFTLSAAPVSKNQTTVNFNGATVLRSDYSIVGTTLTFTSAPDDGALIEITTVVGTVISTTVAETVSVGAQPNITSTGTLASTTFASNANITMSGTLSQITGANLLSGTFVSGNVTSTGTSTFSNLIVTGLTSSVLSSEQFTSLTGATGTVTHDTSLSSTFYHTSAAASFTANFTNVPVTTGTVIVVAIIIAQGSTPYVPTTMQIAGTTQTVIWLGGSAPTGTASKYDIISYSLFRQSGSWTVFGQASTFG